MTSNSGIFYKQSRAIITMVLSLRRVNMTVVIVIEENRQSRLVLPADADPKLIKGNRYWKSLPGMLSTNITRLA
jgi:hypothetical protein